VPVVLLLLVRKTQIEMRKRQLRIRLCCLLKISQRQIVFPLVQMIFANKEMVFGRVIPQL